MSKKRILIVDDDPDFASALELLFKNKGYLVDIAGSLDEAKKSIEINVPNLIILDVMMENYDDGFRLCRELKQDEKFRHIPIIIVTAVTEVTGLKFDPKTDGDYLPAEEYLQKPIETELLLSLVNKYL